MSASEGQQRPGDVPATKLALELSDYLAQAAHQLRVVVDASLDVVTLLNGQGELIFVSASSEAMTGYRPNELIGRNALDLLHPDDVADAAVALSRLVAGETVRHTCRTIRRDGRAVWIEAVARPAASQGMFSAVLRDISERKEMQDLLEYAALRDPVTGLPNRRMIVDELTAAVARAQRTELPPVVLFLDVDELKPVNDTYGHDAGDALLRNVAARLSETVRRGDLAGRYGGDEFVVIAEGLTCPEDEGAALVQRLDELLSAPLGFDGEDIEVSVSIGTAVWRPGMTPEELIDAADRAMYIEKQRRRATRAHA